MWGIFFKVWKKHFLFNYMLNYSFAEEEEQDE
jgi:hypothetical protein